MKRLARTLVTVLATAAAVLAPAAGSSSAGAVSLGDTCQVSCH